MAVTAKQFKVFCRNVNKWVKALNLQSWNIFMNHKDVINEEDSPSSVMYVYESQIAQINLAKNLNCPFSERISDIAAFHEVTHLLFAPLMELFEELPAIKNVALKEEHLIIAALEKYLFDADKEDGDIDLPKSK